MLLFDRIPEGIDDLVTAFLVRDVGKRDAVEVDKRGDVIEAIVINCAVDRVSSPLAGSIFGDIGPQLRDGCASRGLSYEPVPMSRL